MLHLVGVAPHVGGATAVGAGTGAAILAVIAALHQEYDTLHQEHDASMTYLRLPAEFATPAGFAETVHLLVHRTNVCASN